MKNWVKLVKERFNPLFFIPLVALFVSVNGQFAQKIINIDLGAVRFLVVFALAVSFFFRLRLFDDIKDLEQDRMNHPQRPFPRGILSVTQARRVLALLILLELAITFNLGFWPFVVHLVAILFSILMYEDFFLSEDLKALPTLSSMVHFFVIGILALSVATATTGFHLEALNYHYMSFFMMNWFLFNQIEFSRKTYSPQEERKTLSSYSKAFTHIGATALAFSQAVLAILALGYSFQASGFSPYTNYLWIFMVLVIIYFILTLFFVLKPTQGTAKLFRFSSSSFVFIFYVLLLLVFSRW